MKYRQIQGTETSWEGDKEGNKDQETKEEDRKV